MSRDREEKFDRINFKTHKTWFKVTCKEIHDLLEPFLNHSKHFLLSVSTRAITLTIPVSSAIAKAN